MIQISSYSPITPIQQVAAINEKSDQKEIIKVAQSQADTVDISQEAIQAFQKAKQESQAEAKNPIEEFTEKTPNEAIALFAQKPNTTSNNSSGQETSTPPPDSSATPLEVENQSELVKFQSEKLSSADLNRQTEETPANIFNKFVESISLGKEQSTGSILNLVS